MVNPLGTVIGFRRTGTDERSATPNAPATGSRLRLKWGKSRGSVTDDSNRPIETASQDRSTVDSSVAPIKSTLKESTASASAFFDASSDFDDIRFAPIRPGESEEDRMIRLAMEMSLKSFRDNEQPRLSGGLKSSAVEKSGADLNRKVKPVYSQDSVISPPLEQTRLAPACITRNSAAHYYDQLDYARKHLSREEAVAIEKVLHNAGDDLMGRQESCHSSNLMPPSSQHQISLFANPGNQIAAATHLSSDEAAAIEQAIQEAEVYEKEKALKEQEESLKMAMTLQTEEATRYSSSRRHDQFQQSHTNISTSSFVGARYSSSAPRFSEPPNPALPERLRSPAPPQDFNSERSRNRTQLSMDVDDDISFVTNSAYSQFTRSTRSSRETDRSVASIRHSVRRSVDEEIRGPIVEAISSKLIQNCNGLVKEGKKSRVYHAAGANNSGGHDVAVKLFKKVVDFCGTPEQSKLFAQNEYRNLLRAHNARVPVPTPLSLKNNVIFMRFMGETGWPAAQVGALDLRMGSPRWNVIYSQVMVAVRR